MTVINLMSILIIIIIIRLKLNNFHIDSHYNLLSYNNIIITITMI